MTFPQTIHGTNKKAHRWGVKVWVLAESQTGYTHQVEIYKGKSNTARYLNGLGYVFSTIRQPSTNMNLTTYKNVLQLRQTISSDSVVVLILCNY